MINEHEKRAYARLQGELRAVCRLLTMLADDVGDASTNIAPETPQAVRLGTLSDDLNEFEHRLTSEINALGRIIEAK